MHCCRIVDGIKNKNIKNSLGAKWKALVIGWRRDCVVGGMETRFQ